MQKVSKAYKESMKSSLRERAYIMLSFGLINQEAQAKATVEDGDFAYYANARMSSVKKVMIRFTPRLRKTSHGWTGQCSSCHGKTSLVLTLIPGYQR